ncbi:MAG: hypothetical protein ABI763_10355 [Bacteroidota bacterium]
MNPDQRYKPGTCNMGAREVSVRKKFLAFFAVIMIGFTICCFAYCDSIFSWIALIGSSFAVIVLYLEIKYRFCIIFGFFHLYNFKQLGNLEEVQCKEDQQCDNKRVKKIIFQSLFISVVLSSIVHMMAMSHPF